MLTELTVSTNGELMPILGIKPSLSSEIYSLGNDPELLDRLKITTSSFGIQFMFDFINPKDIYFSSFDASENGFISQLSYSTNRGMLSLINERKATSKLRVDGSGIRFEDTTEGYVCVLHGMLRKLFSDFPPNEFLLFMIHSLATKFIYATLVRSFDKQYNLVDSGESVLASIQYACASIIASKHFVVKNSINEVAIASTKQVFSRISPDIYKNSEINTYEKFVNYLDARDIIPGLNLETLIDVFTRKLGPRAFVLLECGIDFLIDLILAKSISRAIPSGIIKTLNEKQIRSVKTIFLENYKKLIANEKNKYNRKIETNKEYSPRW